MALKASDQLRQRMAWALSQIFVVSSAGVNHLVENELWVNYYDIFVRNAFANFRNILSEVTYSPAMGVFLTHKSSKSYDFGHKHPNENYAREIMQLFTIGLFQLHDDGRIKRDDNQMAMPTYDGDDILSVSRAFTGFNMQEPRRNFERVFGKIGHNFIDPMVLWPSQRDMYPKLDLG